MMLCKRRKYLKFDVDLYARELIHLYPIGVLYWSYAIYVLKLVRTHLNYRLLRTSNAAIFILSMHLNMALLVTCKYQEW